MNKSVIKKGLLIVVLITLWSTVLVGCSLIFPATGTVNLSVISDTALGKFIIPIDSIYDIQMDGTPIAKTNDSGNLTIVNVPIGWHNFEAFSNFGFGYTGYGSKSKYIRTGINNVTIPVSSFIK